MPTQQQLYDNLDGFYGNTFSENIDILGNSYPPYVVNYGTYAVLAAIAAGQDPEGDFTLLVNDHDTYQITNSEFLDLFKEQASNLQRTYIAYGSCRADITNNVITEFAEIPIAWASYFDAYTAPTELPTFADLAASVSSIPSTFDDLTDGSTNKAFTSTEKTKLNGIASGATANDTDANLKARANHTGTQAQSTIVNLTTDLADKASASDLTTLAARVTALEAWQTNIKLTRAEAFQATTDANGDVTITTSATFTSPKVLVTPRASAGTEGYHAHVTSVSGTSISARIFHNKTQGVLIGGTIDPDYAATSLAVDLIVVQS